VRVCASDATSKKLEVRQSLDSAGLERSRHSVSGCRRYRRIHKRRVCACARATRAMQASDVSLREGHRRSARGRCTSNGARGRRACGLMRTVSHYAAREQTDARRTRATSVRTQAEWMAECVCLCSRMCVFMYTGDARRINARTSPSNACIDVK
jgi:hypothetical protein